MKVLGRENDVVEIIHTQVERHPGEEFGGLGVVFRTRDGRELKFRFTSETLPKLAQPLISVAEMLGLNQANRQE